MAFDWREFLAAARWLQMNTPPGVSEECAHRTAIGRAYYAAFKYAVEYAERYLGFVPRNNGDDHGRLRAHLRSRRRAATADRLDRLRDARNWSDYQGEFPTDLTKTLEKALEDADYVIASLPPPAAP
jgi:hypothetical protein